ncbi:cytochrome C [Shewanella sp. Actino-trap-3]|jgi:OmcA/MtrC family decaheme c-type cytochrome|uniref:OmcA/MtrC family decaheme c-type cytochrome n=1 Tax=Shewanella sp. Actino-trap-3 TaxID=2058331 RepID=UPI000C336826|nr:OmcA/MtrC family decaheme c-type cytochrome [Shewanella sp. Actino-trap-3]PKG78466.1 cytochrome C [Shewanella sp. Actino-trap-3]
MKKYNRTLLAATLIAALGVTGCGSDGSDGVDGAAGAAGADGTPGAAAGSVATTVENAFDLNITLAPADIVVVGADPFTLSFTAKNAAGVPFSGLEKVALYVTSQSANTTDTGAPMLWTNHALANDFGSSMYCTLTGTAEARGGAVVDACTLVEDAANPGTYTGSWAHDGNAPVVLADGSANDLARVFIRSYNVEMADGSGVSDKVLSTPVDFIPATGELAVSAKDAVSNAACIQCHSSKEGYADTDMRIANIGAHHNYQKVENCVACHNPAIAGGQDDPEVGFNANFNAMIHTIHMGKELAQWQGLQGEALEEFGGVGFPAESTECTVCHDNGTQWNDNVYAEACVSCHLTVDFETGENHKGIVPSSDAACSGCHGAGSLSPSEAHSVDRRDVFENGLVLNVASAEVDADVLTVIIDVTLNGAVPTENTDLTQYLNTLAYGKSILAGTLDGNGDYVPGLSIANAAMFVVNGGKLTLTKDLAANQLDGKTIYVTSEMNMCADTEAGKVVVNTKIDEIVVDDNGDPVLSRGNTQPIAGTDNGACDLAVPANIVTKYFMFGDTAATGVETTDDLRFVSPALTAYSSPTQVGNDRTTADEAKCNACHDNLAHVKSPRHGVTNFTQCAECHTNNYPGSYHATVYQQDGVDDAGEPKFALIEGLKFANRDLATVAHRFHSGLFAGDTGAGIYLDTDGELVNYPAIQTNCQACHKDATPFFSGTGELTSGRTAIDVSYSVTDKNGTPDDDTDDITTAYNEFISPVAEACRSCHAHSGEAALAHFKSNGATVAGETAETADGVAIESCATCHAEGKTYGIDKVHSGAAH